MFLGKSASKSLITPSIEMLVVAPGDHGKAMARSIKIAAIAAVSVCGSAAIAANFNLAVARSLYIYIYIYIYFSIFSIFVVANLFVCFFGGRTIADARPGLLHGSVLGRLVKVFVRGTISDFRLFDLTGIMHSASMAAYPFSRWSRLSMRARHTGCLALKLTP